MIQRDHEELLLLIFVIKSSLLIKKGYWDSSRPSVAQNDTLESLIIIVVESLQFIGHHVSL